MERRNFLKGIFGAAVVAAMPTKVVDQIEKLPEPKPAVLTVKKPETVFVDNKTNIPVGAHLDNCMYLYKNDHLLAYSYESEIKMTMPKIDVSSLAVPYKEYLYGPKHWRVSMKKIKWLQGWGLLDDYFIRHESVTLLLRKGDHIISGEVIIVEKCNMWLGSGWVDIEMEGVGELTLETV